MRNMMMENEYTKRNYL